MDIQSANQPTNSNSLSEVDKLMLRLQSSTIPANLKEKALHQIERIALTLKYGGNLTQIDITSKYIDWITSLPWDQKSVDKLDIKNAKAILDKNHYGLEKIKQRILEFISLLIVQKQKNPNQIPHAPQLFFIGLAGTGKTTIAHSIAEALGRKFIRIPFGGLSSALDLRGQAKTAPESEPGMVIRALRKSQVRNPIILLDELDRITPEARAAVMGVLIELLDPEQNNSFVDYFIDYPFDLSEVIFIATANNSNTLSTAVLDRLEIIQMPSYNDDEKIAIAKSYVLPRYLKLAGLTPENITVDDAALHKIIRPLGYDSGIRSLERAIEAIVRKVDFKIVNGEGQNFTVSETNLKEFIA